jgi:hypothetical protein
MPGQTAGDSGKEQHDNLTAPQVKTLQVLADLNAATGQPVRPREVARALWPDSEGWDKRSSRGSNRTKQGALGATMPMKASQILERLRLRGCVSTQGDGSWQVTPRGLGVLAGTGVPLPKPQEAVHPESVRRRKPPRLRPGGSEHR